MIIFTATQSKRTIWVEIYDISFDMSTETRFVKADQKKTLSSSSGDER